MPDATTEPGALAAPPDRPAAETGNTPQRRERAVLSCAALSYWHNGHPEPTYRHHLGLRAELAYHHEADESPQILIDLTAAAALLVALLTRDMPGRSISLDSAADAVRRGIHVLVTQIDPPASPMWFLHTEPDGSMDLTTVEEPWYPVDPAGRDQVAG